MEELVSIITPMYNCEKYLIATIESVLNQTYKNFEMLLVDDCSTDNSYAIALEYAKKDPRIKVFKNDTNSGAALSRNLALEKSSGRFIAYLDADDIWKAEKLERQVAFMLQNNYGFTCTSYEVIGNDGAKLNKIIEMKKSVNYRGFLTHNLLQTVGIMADLSIIDKKLLVMPNLRRRQDAATWLQVLKTGIRCYGMKEVLAEYRRAENSLSSNKKKAIKGVWYLYREVEHLSFVFSCYCFCKYALYAVWKRIYFKKGK